MRRCRNMLVIAFTLVLLGEARAQEEPLTRDEVAVIKKKLVSILEALGQAPAGYTVDAEHFNLPTAAYKAQQSGRYSPLSAGADRNYGTQKSAEKSGKDLQKDYEKKILEAQAKGDYQAVVALSQEMQQKASAQQLKAVEGRKEPIEVSVNFNSNPYATIDPDAVVFEKGGFVALRSTDQGSSENVRISIYFDPVSLKDTKQLSRVDLKQPEGGVTKRTLVLSITVELRGPASEVEPWATKIDTRKILAQIDAVK